MLNPASKLSALAVVVFSMGVGSCAGMADTHAQTGHRSPLHAAFAGDIREVLDCARRTERLVVVAHRGGPGPGRPENAASTIEANMALPGVLFEFDVHTSRDRVDFLIHDDTLDRETTGSGPVAQTDWAEITTLRQRDPGGVAVETGPTRLSDMLDQLEGRALIMIDLKRPADTGALVRSMAARGMGRSAIFIAYSHDQAREILQAWPQALVAVGLENERQQTGLIGAGLNDQPLVALTGAVTDSPSFYASIDGRHYVLAGAQIGAAASVDQRIRRGEPVPELDGAADAGAHLIVTDHPVAMVSYLQSRNLLIDPSVCGRSSG